jgi:DNA gyrase subunit A
MITCKSGVTIRSSISAIREAGRATQGVKLIRLDDGDEIAAITKLNEDEVDEEINEIANETTVDNLDDATDKSISPSDEPENTETETKNPDN